MKNNIFISILAVLTLSSCGCHNYGLKTGVNVTSIRGDDTENLNSRIGLFFGGFAELCINDSFAIQPELLYSQQGAKYTESDGYDGTFGLDYIQVPVMAKIKVTEEFILEAGPQVGVLISAKDKYESPGDSGEEDIRDDYNDIDFGANIGINYQLESGLNFGARYFFGLSNINDIVGSNDFKSQNGVFSFSIGYKFE